MFQRRRRRPVGSNRPDATTSYVIAGISVISAVTYSLCVYFSIRSNGNTASILGGIGVLCVVVGIICMVTGFKIFRNTNFTLRSRIIGLVAPLLSLGLWVHLYIVGILYG